MAFKLGVIKAKIMIQKNKFCSFVGFDGRLHNYDSKPKPSLPPLPEWPRSRAKLCTNRSSILKHEKIRFF